MTEAVKMLCVHVPETSKERLIATIDAECRALEVMSEVVRKKNWRAAVKAMTLADYSTRAQALAELRAAGPCPVEPAQQPA